MISIVEEENKISRDLLSKNRMEAGRLNAIKLEHQMILEGCLRSYRTYKILVYVQSHIE